MSIWLVSIWSIRTQRSSHWALLILVAVLFANGCTSETNPVADDATIVILAAASTTHAVEEIAREFERNHPGISIEVSAGPSNSQAQQILSGAPADVFVSASPIWTELIVEEGLADESLELMKNRLVLIVPVENPADIHEPEDLLSEEVSRIAIAGRNVPAGMYAEAGLRELDLFEKLHHEGKLVRGSDVRVTLAYVERGEADAGIVYASDALTSDKAQNVCEVALPAGERIVCSAILLNQSAKHETASEFFHYMQSSTAQEIFNKHGFAMLDSKP